MINLNDMVLFAKVAELEGISPAARALNIPKSRVSRRIATLEEELGARLMERTTRAVQLTETGVIFSHHCKRIAEEAQCAVESVNHMMEKPRGTLRLSVSVSLGQYFVAPYLGEFLKLYPEVEVSLDLSNRQVDLINEGFDLAIRVGEQKDSSLMSKMIGCTRALFCASPSYLKENGYPESIEDFHQHKILTMSERHQEREWKLENQNGELKVIDVMPYANINDFTSLRALVEKDAGISFMPDYTIQDALDDKKLIHVLPEWRSPVIKYYVLYPSRSGLTQKARACIDFYSEKFSTLVSCKP